MVARVTLTYRRDGTDSRAEVIAREAGIDLSIVRGRLDPDQVRLCVEISGGRRQVDEALALFRARGIMVSPAPSWGRGIAV